MLGSIDIAILGATGAVGESLLEILSDSDIPVNNLYPLASSDSVGKTVTFKNKTLDVIDAAEFDFAKVQLAFFSAGKQASRDYAPIAAKNNCVVIDNTSEFRMDDEVPLVVPEVNPQDIAKFSNKNIISNPNCSTIGLCVALKPIYDAVGIKRVNVATYQAVSGSGKAAISELSGQCHKLLNGLEAQTSVYPSQIAFNVLAHIDDFEENGYTKEEMKLYNETKKIFSDNSININATAVRVPVFYGHSKAVHIETDNKISADDARELFKKANGIVVVDNPEENEYPTPLEHGSNTDEVFVGRIREDISHPNGLNMWVVSDNIRKGAALNAVQIAKLLINDHF